MISDKGGRGASFLIEFAAYYHYNVDMEFISPTELCKQMVWGKIPDLTVVMFQSTNPETGKVSPSVTTSEGEIEIYICKPPDTSYDWAAAFRNIPGTENYQRNVGDTRGFAVAIFPEGRVIVQVKQDNDLRQYEGVLTDVGIMIDLSKEPLERVTEVIEDLYNLNYKVMQRPVLIDVGSKTPADLLEVSARIDSGCRLRVHQHTGQRLVLHITSEGYQPNEEFPHIQDAIRSPEQKSPLKIRVMSDDPAVLENIVIVREQVLRVMWQARERYAPLQEVQEGEVITVKLKRDREAHEASASHAHIGGLEGFITMTGADYSIEGDDLQLDDGGIQAEMRHHVLDVIFQGRLEEGVGDGERSAFHELFDDIRFHSSEEVVGALMGRRIFVKTHLLISELPSDRLPGSDISGHYIIWESILIHAIRYVQQVEAPGDGGLHEREVILLRNLVAMELRRLPIVLTLGEILFWDEIVDAVETAIGEFGGERSILPGHFIGDSHYPIPSLIAKTIEGMDLPGPLKQKYVHNLEQLAAEEREKHTDALVARAGIGEHESEQAAGSVNYADLVKVELSNLVLELSNEGVDLRQLQRLVVLYYQFCVYVYFSSRTTESIREFANLETEVEGDVDLAPRYTANLLAQGVGTLESELETLQAQDYTLDVARRYHEVRLSLLRMRAAALRKLTGKDDLIDAYEADIATQQAAYERILAIQDELESLMMSPDTGVAFSQELPTGQPKVFASQMHFLDQWMKQVAQGTIVLEMQG